MSRKNVLIALAVVIVAGAVVGANFYFNKEKGLPVTTELLVGSTIAEITGYADHCDVDLIVVGSRGHGMLTNALLGSVSLGVLRHTERPVLVVRGHSAKPLEARTPAGVA